MNKFNFRDLLIQQSQTIKEAMKRLDSVASKILFVVHDDNDKLLGSLSDGDIRRYILSNGSLEAKVIEACNKKTLSVNTPFNEDLLLNKMEELDLIFAPLLDNQGHIDDILSYSSMTKKIIKQVYKEIDIPVIIMAGGKGTRMEPFTNVLPKPLIPIGNKTMLEYIIDEYRKYLIKDFYITINYKGNLIKAYLDSSERDYNITYINETNFLGTAGSLKLMDEVPSRFIVSNCDIVVKTDYNDVLKFHKESNSVLTILSSIQHHSIPYGVVEFENGGRVTTIKEKPEFSMPINTGVYILEKEAWDYIPENTFFHMTHLIETLIKDGKKVMTYPVSENDYVDIGQWDEYKNVIKKFV